MGCVVTEVPEDLKSALRMVSGSTLAGGLDGAAEFTLRGSSLSFFTEGLSLSRLWRAEKSQNPCQFSLRQGGTHHLLGTCYKPGAERSAFCTLYLPPSAANLPSFLFANEKIEMSLL